MAKAQIEAKQPRYRLDGFFRGKVLKHCSHGQCKIWIPGVYPEETIDDPDTLPDAEQAAPLFGGSSCGSGMFSYPRINSIVWCFFQNGDQNFPVYFAVCGSGAEAAKQYSGITDQTAALKTAQMADDPIDQTDKMPTAAVHRLCSSRASVSLSEDGRISMAVDHTNPVAAAGNVNLPYSTSHHMLNDLSSVIFPGLVKNASLVAESSQVYSTLDVLSGLANSAFGISCEIDMAPAAALQEITSKIGASCSKGYLTQCRSVFSALAPKLQPLPSVEKPIYLRKLSEDGYTTVPIDYHWEMFCTVYSADETADPAVTYVVTPQPGCSCKQAKIDGITYRVGDKLQLLHAEKAADITKSIVKKIKVSALPRCKVFIAAEDCEIDKWDYIRENGFDLYLCSPSQFGNPVKYFDKPLDGDYPQQCPKKVWPALVAPYLARYGASIILIEDRRKHVEQRFSKSGSCEMQLSDAYEESWLTSSTDSAGAWSLKAFKQDYAQYDPTGRRGTPVQANVSGYSVVQTGMSNVKTDSAGSRLSAWNYSVQPLDDKHKTWQYFNQYINSDCQHGLSIVNSNLSVNGKPEYWKLPIAEVDQWPRWSRKEAPSFVERLSSSLCVDMDAGYTELNLMVHKTGNGSDDPDRAWLSADRSGVAAFRSSAAITMNAAPKCGLKPFAEILLDGGAGAIKMTAQEGSGTVTICGNLHVTGNLVVEGTATVNGDVAANSDVVVAGDVTAGGDVVAGGISLKSHTHPAPGGVTGIPS